MSEATVGSGRRAQILEVATALFREKGYHATALDDIAEVIGFTKPAIYYYFASKEDILFTIVSEHVDRALQRVQRIAEGPGPVQERLHALLVENTRTILHNLDVNSVFYNERGRLSPAREVDMRERERRYTGVVRDLYVEGVAAGVFHDRNPTVVTATLLGASIWTYRWFHLDGSLTIEEVAVDVASLLMAGYLR